MSADDSLTFILLKFDCETSVLAKAEYLPLLDLRLGTSDHRTGIPVISLKSPVSCLFHFSVIHYIFDGCYDLLWWDSPHAKTPGIVAFMFTVENYIIAW